MRPLPHPPDAEHDEDSLEMLRGWVVDGALQISLAAWVWQEEPAQWGRLLAETVGHLSDALSKETSQPRGDIFDEIVRSLKHFLANPQKLEGEFVDPAPELHP